MCACHAPSPAHRTLCPFTGELGAAGEQLQQLAAKEAASLAKQGPEEALKEALEPKARGGQPKGKSGGVKGKGKRKAAAAGYDAPIPVEPAVEGELM